MISDALSTWLTVILVSIGFLTILVTVGTVIATLLIYFQSRDYRMKTEEDRKAFQQDAASQIETFLMQQKEFIAGNQKAYEESDGLLKELITNYREKLTAIIDKNLPEKIKLLEDGIQRLELERASLRTTIRPVSLFSSQNLYAPNGQALGYSLTNNPSMIQVGSSINGVARIVPSGNPTVAGVTNETTIKTTFPPKDPSSAKPTSVTTDHVAR